MEELKNRLRSLVVNERGVSSVAGFEAITRLLDEAYNKGYKDGSDAEYYKADECKL